MTIVTSATERRAGTGRLRCGGSVTSVTIVKSATERRADTSLSNHREAEVWWECNKCDNCDKCYREEGRHFYL